MGFLLSPATSPVCVTAAVQNGADAVYFQTAPGGGRPNALNMSEARSAISYCSMRGVQSFLNIGAHPTDRELGEWAVCLTDLLQHGLTGVLLCDLGVLRMARMILPELPVHVAPDAGVLSVKSARHWASAGASRIWLSPCLSRERLAYIIRNAGVPCGVTVAGELCAGLPGACNLSGGRGVCRRGCASPYGISRKPEGAPLAPLPFSLHECVPDLQAMGAEDFGIFDLHHGPEWTALVTRMWREVLDTGKPPKENDVLLLKTGFHPEGLTHAAFLGQPPSPPEPLPAVENPAVTVAEIMAGLRASYENVPERQRIPVKFNCIVKAGHPVCVAVKDDLDNIIKVMGAKPTRRADGLLEAEVNTQLYKLLGTPYRCVHARSRVEDGLSVPISVIADLRRAALERLTQQRRKNAARKPGQFHSGVKYLQRQQKPVMTIWVRHMSQLSRMLSEQKPAVLYVPLMELKDEAARLKPFEANGTVICPWIPRGLGDHEQNALSEALTFAVSLGITELASPCPGYAPLLQKSGLSVRSDWGDCITNSQALKEYKHMGYKSALLSHELTLQQVRELSHALDTELPVYGRMPLLLTEHCLMKSPKGVCNCDNLNTLVDASGARAPMCREFLHRTGVYGASKLFMGHRLNELDSLGLWAVRLCFVTENARECAVVAERYNGVGKFSPGEYVQYDPAE